MPYIVIVGDVHLDQHWEFDQDRVLKQIIGVCHDNYVTDVVLLGDIYHSRDV